MTNKALSALIFSAAMLASCGIDDTASNLAGARIEDLSDIKLQPGRYLVELSMSGVCAKSVDIKQSLFFAPNAAPVVILRADGVVPTADCAASIAVGHLVVDLAKPSTLRLENRAAMDIRSVSSLNDGEPVATSLESAFAPGDYLIDVRRPAACGGQPHDVSLQMRDSAVTVDLSSPINDNLMHTLMCQFDGFDHGSAFVHLDGPSKVLLGEKLQVERVLRVRI